MSLNTSNDDLMTRRREMVASLRLRGLTLREISAALANQTPPFVNPKTKKPYDAATIKSDLDALKEEWRANAAQDTDAIRAQELAEITEIKRAAWSQKNPELALKALDREMKLAGTMKQPGGVTVNINIDILARFEKTARDLGQDPDALIEEFMGALLAQSTAGTAGSR